MDSIIDTEGKLSKFTLSILNIIYNKRMNYWYEEFGLLKNSKQQFMKIVNDKPMFELNVKTSFLQKTKASFVFPNKARTVINSYNPKKIDSLYEKERKKQYSIVSNKEFTKKLGEFVEILVENTKFSVLGSLITQYKLGSVVPQKYYSDVRAQKLNAIGNKDFSSKYGFYSDEDYEFSLPRYEEKLPKKKNNVKVNESPNNFRDHVRMRSSKMVYLIRKLMLANKVSFNKSYEEILGMEENKIKTGKLSSSTLSGKLFSGKGNVQGKARILTIDDAYKIKKGEIAVVSTLHPDLVTILPLVKGIISEYGSSVAHLSIVAREQDKTVIGKVANCTKLIKTGDIVKIEKDSIRKIKKHT